jgi:hypothetical protein
MSLPPPLCRPRPISPFHLTLSPMPPPLHNWHPTTPRSHRKPWSTSLPPSQISIRQSTQLLTGLSPLSTAKKSPMGSKLRSATRPTASSRRSSRSMPRRSTRNSSSRAAPMAMSLTTAVFRPSSPSERDSSCLPSSSNSGTMDESCAYQGRSIIRTCTQLTSSSVLITHRKTSLSPSLSGSIPYSTALLLPTTPSIAPLPTSMTETLLPKSSVTIDKTIDCAISATSSPSSKLRCYDP